MNKIEINFNNSVVTQICTVYTNFQLDEESHILHLHWNP